jgi:hypothetical protein
MATRSVESKRTLFRIFPTKWSGSVGKQCWRNSPPAEEEEEEEEKEERSVSV